VRVTVCQWPDETRAFTQAWEQLAAHVTAHRSELVLLPQMPFSRCLATSRRFDPALWKAAVEAHDAWQSRLHELGAAAVLGTRPVDFGNERYDTGFVWQGARGYRAAHANAFLSNEEGAWEATWCHHAFPEFTPAQIGAACVGFLICAEACGANSCSHTKPDTVSPTVSSVSTKEVPAVPVSTAEVRPRVDFAMQVRPLTIAELCGGLRTFSQECAKSSSVGGVGYVIYVRAEEFSRAMEALDL